MCAPNAAGLGNSWGRGRERRVKSWAVPAGTRSAVGQGDGFGFGFASAPANPKQDCDACK